MKFKTIFILFNIVVVSALFFILLMPLFILGPEFHSMLIQKNAAIVGVFLILLIILNIYFIRNWKLYQLLESENWTEVGNFLEKQIFEKNNLSKRNIRLYINTSLLLSKIENLEKLLELLQKKDSKQIEPFAIELGIPYLIEQKSTVGAEYFSQFENSLKGEALGWVLWAKAFCLLNLRQIDEVKETLLKALENTQKEPLILLSTYLMGSLNPQEEDILQVIKTYKEWLASNHTKDTLERNILKAREKNVIILLFSKVYSEALIWAFPEKKEVL